MNSRKICPRAEDIPAYLQRELDEPAAMEIERHVARCPVCAEALQEYASLIERLQQDPDQTVNHDLAPDILDQIGRSTFTRLHIMKPLLRIAALLVGLLGLGLLFHAANRASRSSATAQAPAAQPADATMARAMAWLRRSQEEDGHWDSARWGAQKMYEPGITALALLALMNNPTGHVDSRAELEKGLHYLASLQHSDGRIGKICSGTPYNQGMATLALLEACGTMPGSRWQTAADRAVDYILSTQRSSGGWGYPRETTDQGNTSITAWQLQALIRAEELGRKDLRPRIEQALAWMSTLTDSEGRIGYSRTQEFPNGYETLTAAGAFCLLKAEPETRSRQKTMLNAVHQAARQAEAIDYYRFYFLTQALHTENTAQSRQLAAALRLKLATTQNLKGEHSGSWEPDDRWSSAGGRIYTTAMAALSMQ